LARRTVEKGWVDTVRNVNVEDTVDICGE